MIELHTIVNDLDSAAPSSVQTMDLKELAILVINGVIGPYKCPERIGALKYVELWARILITGLLGPILQKLKKIPPQNNSKRLVTCDSERCFLAKVPNIFS